jgi:undecaprenyl-diphosphatase
MWSWINACVALVAHNPAGALAIAFLAAIIEAVAVLGILVPGTPIMMAVAGAAALAGQDMLPFLGLAVLGAVTGDFVSFIAGGYYNARLRRAWPFTRHPELITDAGRFFERYGMASVALCRFVPVLRSTVPLVAGMAGMRRDRFVVANVLSAFVWAPLHIYPAKLAGLSLGRLQAGDWASAALWGALFLACAAAAWGVHHALVSRQQRPGR